MHTLEDKRRSEAEGSDPRAKRRSETEAASKPEVTNLEKPGQHKGSNWHLCGILCFVLYVVLPFILTPTYPIPDPAKSAILVTGASTGIGKHAAIELAQKGFTVFAGVRSLQAGAELEKDAETTNLISIPIDVTQAASQNSARIAIEEIMTAKKLQFVGLVNNAGIGCSGPLEIVPEADLRAVFEVNVFGLMTTTQVFLPLLRAAAHKDAQGGARIVNIGSLAGVTSAPLGGAYHATKHALETITDSLRMELQAQGISVSLVEPGAVVSKIVEKQEAAAERLVHNLAGTGELETIYLPFFKARQVQLARALPKADTPQVTTDAIVHALTSPSPQTRYLVANVDGVAAWVVRYLAWLVPDRVLDWVTLFAFRNGQL